MKKIIICLSLFVLVSTCFVTNAMATPEITAFHGGLGFSATVENAKGLDWEINLKGPAVVFGSKTVGTITSKSETIRTSMSPLVFGMGPIKIFVTIDRIILPDLLLLMRPGFILGPFVLVFMKF